ncbi:DUF7439 family protein [Actinacidiphila glaucinigra]|uniref:Uncharacterized protein n=1 Tax=Actinacidiphila glaucinigra TaxID=235986 RepID=A0A239F143_9ACTN|nr:hypothetical protein [Actinacidiphila glaucinigra]SNS50646.1 hypothetical protein SAMN05216252_106260 [Actinacidiphila glaucinigra]
MSKHRKPVAAFLSFLPVRYRSRAGAIVAALGVLVSVLAIVYADRPEVALIIQVATALGLVDGPDSE